MLRSVRKLATVAVLIGAATFFAPTPAKAIFEIRFTDVTAGLTVVAIDDILNDQNPLANIIRFVGTVGAFSIDATVATTTAAPGSGTLDSVGVSSGSITYAGSGAHVLQIFTTSTGFLVPTPPVTVNSSGGMTVNGNSSAAVKLDFTSYVDGSNLPFGTAISTPTVSVTVNPGQTLSGNAPSTSVPVLGTPYSISSKAVYTFSASSLVDNSGGTTNVKPNSIVPGPGGLALVLAGLPFFGFFRRRGK